MIQLELSKPEPTTSEFADIDAWVEEQKKHTDEEWDEMSFLRRWAELCEQPGPITDDDIRVSCGAVG